MIQTDLKQKNEFSLLLFTHANVLRFLNILAIALIAVSLLYLMAANWWMLPKFVRLSIPMLVLILSAVASVYVTQSQALRQSLDTISGLMLGLSLAVIGQIYQTGADSYLLFLVWSVLLLPWLYRPNIGVFCILVVVSHLALYFYFQQSFWMLRAPWAYVVALNSLTAISLIYAMRHYPILRYVFIVFLIVISLASMFRFVQNHQVIDLVSVFVLPLGAAYYFYRRQRVLEPIILIAGVALSLSLWLLESVSGFLSHSGGGLFTLAMMIFAWFAVISFVLTRLFPKNNLAMIPLAIGAWIAGIILAGLLLTFWQAFSIVMGVVFIIIAWFLLSKYTSFFIRQFAYCLWVCGQTAILTHVGLITDNLWYVWFIQLLMLSLTAFTAKHWFILTIQLIAAYCLGVAALLFMDILGGKEAQLQVISGCNTLIFIIMLLTARYWQSSIYMKSIVLWLLFILFGVAACQMLIGLNMPFLKQAEPDQIIIFYLLPSIFVLCFVLQRANTLHHLWFWAIPILGLFFILMGYFELFIVLVLLAWAIVYGHKWVQAMCILLLVFWLWMLYYYLGLSFLYKSLTIFISGLMLLMMVYGLKQIEAPTHQGEIS
ncbi:DUF2157 domain-containing protein [Acinetobacter sp. 194]|uniref:DUF2157 domain-containing protein n=1 Tax=Acinetobacter shaoyimingii TaxID=2715164 RepID=UPI00140B2BF4|nr:DUF2157 domain-containing protein [Acinetobacter shaoyimingii]NHB58348.1 DUF2157 domain-containing protein [Acinetobacter shaoyimingii]